MSYLRYLRLFANTYCVVFLFYLSTSGVSFIAFFSGMSLFECPFGIL
jgi:hypothetical protein